MADGRVITAYDERPEAVAPGPTVDAVLAGTLGGTVAVVGTRLLGDAPVSVSGLLVGTLALAAGAWAGVTAQTVLTAGRSRAGRQGALAGLLVGTWGATSHAMAVALLAANDTLQAGSAAGSTGHALLGAGVSDALLVTSGTAAAAMIGGAALGGGAGFVSARIADARGPRRRAPIPLDPTATEWVLRVLVQAQALLALGFAFVMGDLTPYAGAAGRWASLDAALVVWETALHASAAAAAALVVRAVWRLPRTAPETRVRALTDGLGIAVLLLAFLTFRVRTGGGPLTWIAPLVPWTAAVVALRTAGRPAPPPPPVRVPLPVPHALALGALVSATLAGLSLLYAAPGLVVAIGVLPWTAAAGDSTADLPTVAPLLAQSDDIVRALGPRLAQVGLVVAAVAWVVRAAATRWLAPRADTPAHGTSTSSS